MECVILKLIEKFLISDQAMLLDLNFEVKLTESIDDKYVNEVVKVNFALRLMNGSCIEVQIML